MSLTAAGRPAFRAPAGATAGACAGAPHTRRAAVAACRASVKVGRALAGLDTAGVAERRARRFAVKGVGKFIGDVIGINGAESIEILDTHKVRINLRGTTLNFFKIFAQNYNGGPFDFTEMKAHATEDDPWALE